MEEKKKMSWQERQAATVTLEYIKLGRIVLRVARCKNWEPEITIGALQSRDKEGVFGSITLNEENVALLKVILDQAMAAHGRRTTEADVHRSGAIAAKQQASTPMIPDDDIPF